jgi:hypothetical protein
MKFEYFIVGVCSERNGTEHRIGRILGLFNDAVSTAMVV